MKRLTLFFLSLLACPLALANQGPFYAAQDDVDVIIGPIAVYSADGTTLATYDFNTAGLTITCMSPQSGTTHTFTQASAEIDDESSHTTHGDPAAGQIGLDVDATGLSFLHFTDDLWSVGDWRYYGCHISDGGTALMDTDFIVWRIESADDVATDVRAEMDANSTHANDALVANHLDHLLQAAYDPSSPPGAVDALLNELIENDGGLARFTSNALEQGPTGGGDSAAVIADAVWEEALADHDGTAGSTAEALSAATGGGASVSAIADGVWTELIADHSGVSGSVAEALSDVSIEGNVGLTPQAITDIWAHVVEPNGSITAKCALGIQLAALAGEYLQAGGSVTIEDHTGATTRVTATVTANGRNNVAYTCP